MLGRHSYNPESLAARVEILERNALYMHANDRRRWDLMAHVFHDDAIWNMSSFSAPNWRATLEIVRDLFDRHLLTTHHQIGQSLINIDGDVALTEIYCTSYHRVRADAPLGGLFGGTGYEYDLIGGLRYVDRFEKRGGEWKIVDRRGASDWRHIQPAADGILSTVQPAFRGSRDGNDSALIVTRSLST